MLAYYDGCNDNGRISILDLNSMTTSNFENVMWVDNWVVGIKSEFELIISDGKSTFSFDTNKQIKNSTPIGKPRYKKSLWNWTRNLEKFKK